MDNYLFVPGSHPERFEKAFATGVDHVIIDLEDAVDASQKETAREHIIAFAKSHPDWRFSLRISSYSKARAAYEDDLNVVAAIQALENAAKIEQIVLTKVEATTAIEEIYARFQLPVLALIETVKGWKNLSEIATAKGLYAFSFGQLDLANELGLQTGSLAANTVMDRLRTDLLLASRIHDLHGPIDTVYPAFEDDEGLANVIKHWQNFGFKGMLCIHPKQVVVLSEMCGPSALELSFAKEVVEIYEQQGLAAFQVRGRMVDLPVIERCREVLKNAK